jgi:hypothetical protein
VEYECVDIFLELPFITVTNLGGSALRGGGKSSNVRGVRGWSCRGISLAVVSTEKSSAGTQITIYIKIIYFLTDVAIS